MTHYYDSVQDSPLRESELRFTVRGKTYSMKVASGLFSIKKLDNATRLLLETIDLTDDSKVLDLGCGWGVMAIVLKDCFPHITMRASDINTRAVAYTKKNAEMNSVSLSINRSDCFNQIPDDDFDVIITNPPYAAGRDVCFSFIENSYKHLRDGGRLHLVARHTKGGKMLSKKMGSVFGNVSDKAKQGGFRVYTSYK